MKKLKCDFSKEIREIFIVERQMESGGSKKFEFENEKEAEVAFLRMETDALISLMDAIRWRIGHVLSPNLINDMQEISYEIGERLKDFGVKYDKKTPF